MILVLPDKKITNGGQICLRKIGLCLDGFEVLYLSEISKGFKLKSTLKRNRLVRPIRRTDLGEILSPFFIAVVVILERIVFVNRMWLGKIGHSSNLPHFTGSV